MDVVEDIKARVDIVDLVGQYVPLKKAGRSFKAICPFHNEKTPSFIVSPEKQLAYCFGCNRGGDIFRFLQEIEGLDFISALKLLAEKTGVALPSRIQEPGIPKDERQRLYEIHEMAAAYFQKQLWETKIGEKVLMYLRKKRMLSDDTINRFRLGYASEDKQALTVFLLEKGFSKQEIIKAGVTGSGDTALVDLYDRFRGRLIFPIVNHAGLVCAFGGRALRDGDEPKYLNSPDTPLYHKEQLLFGLHEAKAAIRREGAAVVVEGYMDVIQAVQSGIGHVVASSGTALSISHIRILKRFTQNLIFFFDADAAGIQAAKRALPLAQTEDMNVSILCAKEGKDPDEWLQKDPKAVKEALAKAPSYMDFYFEELHRQFDLKTIQGQKAALAEILPVIHRIANTVEKDHHIKQLARELGIKADLLYDEMNRFVKTKGAGVFITERGGGTKNDPSASKTPFSLAEYLLGFIIYKPAYCQSVSEKVAIDDLPSPLKDIYKALVDFYNLSRGPIQNESTVLDTLSPPVRERAKILALFIEERFASATQESIDSEFKKILDKFFKQRAAEHMAQLLQEMKMAEQRTDKKRAAELFAHYHQLLTQSYGQED